MVLCDLLTSWASVSSFVEWMQSWYLVIKGLWKQKIMWYKTPGAAAEAKQVTILECLVYEHRLCARTQRRVLCRVKPVQPTQETPRVSKSVYTWPCWLPRAPMDSSSRIWWISYLVWHLGGRGFGNSESCLGFLTAIWCIYHRAYSRAKDQPMSKRQDFCNKTCRHCPSPWWDE